MSERLKISRSSISTVIAISLVSSVLSGCAINDSAKPPAKSSSVATSVVTKVPGAGKKGAEVAEVIDGVAADPKVPLLDTLPAADSQEDLKALKEQFKAQQQQLEQMSAEQQALQEQLKRQRMTLQLNPLINANAGVAKQGMASSAMIAFLEEESQFTELEERAIKEITVIPGRSTDTVLNIPLEAKYIAVKVGLRHTKKRSQFLLPLASIDFDNPLALNIGACDVQITAGVLPALTPKFTSKIEYYQQPLVRCQ